MRLSLCQLCDDSFEEHVLRITEENTGLHLHGLNECSKHFKTMLPDVVDAFAREWGLIPTKSTELNSIAEVKEFTERIGNEGTWLGEPLEGFVVRTHVSEPPTKDGIGRDASPYEPGSSFFFKVKFDEPYMMYRDWREVTKMLLSTKDKNGVAAMKASSLPTSKMRRTETVEYVQWVIGDIKRHPQLFAEFGKGKGIIAARQRFFSWKDGGGVVEPGEKDGDAPVEAVKRRTIIAPIAIPG